MNDSLIHKIDVIVPPTRFVGLHGHSGFSTYDGLGYPKEHIDFVTSESQGMDSWALTDHGNGSGLAHARSHTLKLQKSGKKYRQLYGVEFYFVPSLSDWQSLYDHRMDVVEEVKTAKKSKNTDDDIIASDDDEEQGGHIIEDEEETKKTSSNKPEWKKYYHLVVIAKNQTGLSNLFTLVKKSFKDGFHRFPRIDYKMLKEHGEGLIVSTACVGGYASGLIYKHFKNKSFDDLTPDLVTDPVILKNIMTDLENMTDRFVDCVGRDNFFLELQFNNLPAQHLTNRCLIDLSQKTNIPLIATPDSHFPDPTKWKARELYKKLGWMGTKFDQTMLPKFEDLKCVLYPKNARQMWDEFKVGHNQYDFYHGKEEIVKNAIERTHDIAWNHCEDTWIDIKAKLPKFDTKEQTAFNQLTYLVKERMTELNLHLKPDYVARIKEELSDIKYLGHASYFLTMYEVFHRAEKRTLLGPGRGSAPGSLVNFILGITQIDPIEYDLLWHRFLGRHRVSWPDIDSDAGDRDVLIDEARKLYGDDAVIPVSNFNTLKLKSLVKSISKFFEIPFEEVNAMTGPLQDEVMPHAKDDDQEKSVFVLKHDDCMKYSAKYREFMTKYPEVEECVNVLMMQNSSIGRHAGGCIIAQAEDLEKTMPIISVRGELQTPWTEGMNFRNLEDNGFLKFDFLGLTLLKDVENCIARILKNQGIKNPSFEQIRQFFDNNLNCRFVKQDDPDVWRHVYHEGRFCSVFQFTNEGARRFCLEAKPNSIEELAAITAIYRPGPLRANVHKLYVEAKKNVDKIKYDHPIIQRILGPTYGYTVYQEQFMNLAQHLAGFTPGEADQLRKTLVKKSLDTIGKKGSEKEIARKKFIDGALSLNGVPESITAPLWDKIEAFSVYGFNRSHSVAYAIDSYYAAWLHTHYEKEWLATALQSENGNPKGIKKTIAEIKAMGYKFAPIDVNYSGSEWIFSEEINAFVPPLSSLKGVGDSATEEIMYMRPYHSLNDLLYDEQGEWKHSKMNKTAFRSLCMTEAFNSLEEFKNGILTNHRQLIAILTDDKNYDLLRKGRWGMSDAQVRKLEKKGEKPEPVLTRLIEQYRNLPDWSRVEKVTNHMELTSSINNDLVFPEKLLDKIKDKQIKSFAEIAPNAKDIGWFCITEVIAKSTKNGKSFYRLRVLDDDNNTGWLRVWNKMQTDPEPFTLWLGELHNDPNWGLSTSSYKMKRITAYD